jgi:predicted CXXCH cytochrome family protein
MRGIHRSGILVGVAKAALALAMLAAGAQVSAQTGISGTKHNLGTTGAAGQNRVTAGTDEICVFCHTPHASNTTVEAPLWNKRVSGATYTTYSTTNSTTIDGTVLPVGSVSLACLSCHDGTQAMDNIVNAPGSGGYDVNGGGTPGLGYTWDTATGRVDSDGKLLGVASLGADLTNDHPIGIQYCGGGPNATTPTGACKDPDFVAPKNASINSKQVWWVDTPVGVADARNKTDMILYTRAFGGTDGPSVECASCHDPHVKQGEGSAGATFLRVANTGSAVCLSCHVK